MPRSLAVSRRLHFRSSPLPPPLTSSFQAVVPLVHLRSQVYGGSSLAASNAARAQQLIEESRAAHPEPLTVSGKYAAKYPTQVRQEIEGWRLRKPRSAAFTLLRCEFETVCALGLPGPMYVAPCTAM
jgi:hypothetical protein